MCKKKKEIKQNNNQLTKNKILIQNLKRGESNVLRRKRLWIKLQSNGQTRQTVSQSHSYCTFYNVKSYKICCIPYVYVQQTHTRGRIYCCKVGFVHVLRFKTAFTQSNVGGNSITDILKIKIWQAPLVYSFTQGGFVLRKERKQKSFMYT